MTSEVPDTPESPMDLAKRLSMELLTLCTSEDRTSRRDEIQALLVELRQLHFIAQRMAHEKELQVAEKKSDLEVLEMDMKNILYRNANIQAKINEFNEYKSPIDEIEFVPVEELHAAKPETKDLAGQQLLMARLDYEQEQRTDLFCKKVQLTRFLEQENKRVNGMQKDLQSYDLTKSLSELEGLTKRVSRLLDYY